jgi:predicted MPP superfamily phosphohydrolase
MGVQNWGPNFLDIGDLDKAIRGVDTSDFKILLSHDPSHWKRVVKDYPEKVQLTLSGHTHGFQYGIETRWFKWSPIQRVYENWAGLYEHDGRYLYVNRGFGFVGFSGRIGIWPEITIIELRKE